MTKEEYIESNIIKLLHNWTNIAIGVGSLVIVALSLLDYLVTPSNFKKFLLYRIITAFAIFLIYLFNRKKISRNRQHISSIVAGVIVSGMVALMIANFGGHESPYFAGMILAVIFVVGLTSLNVKMSIINSFIIYGFYLVPILVYDTISNKTFFINANTFILSTIFSLILLRYLIKQRFVSEFSLQYDLEQQKEQLKIYSTKLEDLVDQRTKELSISEQKFRALFDYANDGVAVLDRRGFIVNVNNKFCELHGFEKDSLIGTEYRLLEAKETEDEKKERMEKILKGEAFVFETEHFRKDGTRIFLEVSSKAIDIGGELYTQSFHRDIAERKRLQEQLFQSQKMESIGLLAGGIAHDFNNILTAILGHAELLHEYSDLDQNAKQRVKIIESSSRKAGQMVTKLFSFARRRSLEILPINLNDVIRDTFELLERMMSQKNINVDMALDDSIPPINGDGNQLEQVIMNLIVNAIDAIPDKGTITIKTSFSDLRDGATHIHPLLPPGKYVCMTISDTGRGIPDEIKGRIFDPFFTTKGRGKGTGLGLAMVYGIVKEHKGVINVESQVGKGTTFEVYLPASDSEVYRIEKPLIRPIVGREKILVVDDETDILSFIKDSLEAQGYKVTVTDNPVYALDIFKNIFSEIDLVITDIVMPLVNGRELIRHFKLIKPKVKIIAISGYDTSYGGKKDKDIDAFIKKPFEGIFLLSVVRRVLDSGVMKGIDSGY